jgi:hypothetical protein
VDVTEQHSGERLLHEMRSLESEPRVAVPVVNQPSIQVSVMELQELVLNVLAVSVCQ